MVEEHDVYSNYSSKGYPVTAGAVGTAASSRNASQHSHTTTESARGEQSQVLREVDNVKIQLKEIAEHTGMRPRDLLATIKSLSQKHGKTAKEALDAAQRCVKANVHPSKFFAKVADQIQMLENKNK